MSALFGFTGPPDDARLEHMTATLAHRGGGPVIASRAELGCIAYLPPPRWSGEHGGLAEDGARALVLVGFVTNRMAEDLPRAILTDYARDGLDALTGLHGAFAMAIRDGEELILMRDPLGARALYHGRVAGGMCFAVEPKAIWSLPGFSRRLRPRALARYLSFSFQPTRETMLEDIETVLPGHLLRFRAGELMETLRYSRFEERDPEPGEPNAWPGRFRELLGEAIRDRLREHEPVGAFLSGGIDSSAVVAELARQTDTPIKTYAVHFGKGYPHELDFAREVAERCGTEHEEVEVKPKHFLRDLRRIVYYLDDPIGDPVTLPNYLLAKHVRGEVRAVFNGEGGDPCFGGPKNLAMMLLHWYGLPREPLYLEKAYLASYRRAFEELDCLLTPEIRAGFDIDRDLAGVLTPFLEAEKPSPLLNRLMAINIRLKGAQLILPKVERMLGANGLVPLSPLFDERLAEASFQMPPGVKLAKGIEKLVIKDAYRELLPASVIDRPKSGMRVPVHFWFKGEMKRFARKILSKRELKKAGIFRPERVKQLLRYDIEEGRGRYGIKLWMLLTFEIWRRIVIEGEPL